MIKIDKCGNPYSFASLELETGRLSVVCRRGRAGEYRVALGSYLTLVFDDVAELDALREALDDLRDM